MIPGSVTSNMYLGQKGNLMTENERHNSSLLKKATSTNYLVLVESTRYLGTVSQSTESDVARTALSTTHSSYTCAYERPLYMYAIYGDLCICLTTNKSSKSAGKRSLLKKLNIFSIVYMYIVTEDMGIVYDQERNNSLHKYVFSKQPVQMYWGIAGKNNGLFV